MGAEDIEAATAHVYEHVGKQHRQRGWMHRGWMQRGSEGCFHRLRTYCSIIAASPSILIAPIVLLGLMVGLGVWAVFAFAGHVEAETVTRAQGLAASSGYGLQVLMSQFYQPVLALASLLQMSKSWPSFEPSFAPLAAMLYSSVPDGYVNSLTVRPNAGFALGVYPPNASYARLDFLNDTEQKPATLAFISNGRLSVDVLPNSDPRNQRALRVRIPVFVTNVSANETFGLPPSQTCPTDICYNSTTRTKFWGIVAAGINLEPLQNLSNPYFAAIAGSNYLLRLTKTTPNSSSAPFLIAQTDRAPGPNAIRAMLDIPGGAWILEIEPCAGWAVVWRGPAIAAVVLFALASSVLLLLLLISRKEHAILLSALVPKSVLDKVKGEEGYVSTLRERSSRQLDDSGTPAEKMLSIVTCLLDGGSPATSDLVQIRHALLDGANLYQPMDLEEQMAAALDTDVHQALIKTLGGKEVREDALLDDESKMVYVGRSAGSALLRSGAADNCSSSLHDFSTVRGGLQAILGGCQTDIGSDTSSRPLSGVVTCSLNPDSANLPENVCALSQVLITTQPRSSCGTPTAESYATAPPGYSMAAAGLLRKGSNCTEATLKVQRAVLVDEVEALLATSVSSWKFDAFALDEVSMGHGLSTLGFFLIQRAGLVKAFKASPQALARFLCAVEAGYRSNPYHNSLHASSVLHAMHMFICYGGLLPGYVDHLSHLACYLAAIIHDYEHKGLTNDFLINSCDPLASLYNDRSPMENHHLAAALELLRQPQNNFLTNLSRTSMAALRKLVIDLVLATDMKQHFATVSQFSTVHMLPANPNAEPSVHRSSAQKSNYARRSVESGPGGDSSGQVMELAPIDDAERLLSLQMALKCSDLSHLFNDLDVHIRWVGCLEREFFEQGDREKDAGLPVSPLFDRDKPGVSKSQVGFYSFVAEPLFRHFTKVFKGAKPAYKQLLDNLAYWRKIEEEAKQKEAAALGTAMSSNGGTTAGRKSIQIERSVAPTLRRPSADPSSRSKPPTVLHRPSAHPLSPASGANSHQVAPRHLTLPPLAVVKEIRGSN